MKYLYCPKCKELRVKPWYSIRNRCFGCYGEATVIVVPNSWMTYVSYVLYVVVPLLVVVYVSTHVVEWIYAAIALLIVMIVLQYLDIVRGEKFAKAKIRVTVSDTSKLRGRNWDRP